MILQVVAILCASAYYKSVVTYIAPTVLITRPSCLSVYMLRRAQAADQRDQAWTQKSSINSGSHRCNPRALAVKVDRSSQRRDCVNGQLQLFVWKKYLAINQNTGRISGV